MKTADYELVCAADIVPRARRHEDWGGWHLRDSMLCYPAYPNDVYPLDLTNLGEAAALLCIIAHIARKTWATDACVAGLVRALDDILNPPANLRFGEVMPRAEVQRRIMTRAEVQRRIMTRAEVQRRIMTRAEVQRRIMNRTGKTDAVKS
jgi:hypothetical protein